MVPDLGKLRIKTGVETFQCRTLRRRNSVTPDDWGVTVRWSRNTPWRSPKIPTTRHTCTCLLLSFILGEKMEMVVLLVLALHPVATHHGGARCGLAYSLFSTSQILSNGLNGRRDGTPVPGLTKTPTMTRDDSQHPARPQQQRTEPRWRVEHSKVNLF